MSAFFLTFVSVLLAGLGARDQVVVAEISARQGQRGMVLVTGAALAVATAALAAWAASLTIPLMQPAARVFLCALALLFAGGEAIFLFSRSRNAEPTHSLGALAIVLLAHQIIDATRFVVFGVAIAAKAPLLAGAGGALAGMALIGMAWAFPHLVMDTRMRIVRRTVGAGFVAVGCYVAMRALDGV